MHYSPSSLSSYIRWTTGIFIRFTLPISYNILYSHEVIWWCDLMTYFKWCFPLPNRPCGGDRPPSGCRAFAATGAAWLPVRACRGSVYSCVTLIYFVSVRATYYMVDSPCSWCALDDVPCCHQVYLVFAVQPTYDCIVYMCYMSEWIMGNDLHGAYSAYKLL